MHEVDVTPVPLQRLASLLAPERAARLVDFQQLALRRLDARVVWNINSTARGGGVAEMLQALLAYANGAGIRTRWLVLEGDPAFFAVTKRLHNRLHGMPGDDGGFDAAARAAYLATLARDRDRILEVVRPGDLVLLHDPQTAGLAGALRDHGAYVVWRCHIGVDEQNSEAEAAWAFLREFLEPAQAFIFSRPEYAPAWMPREWQRFIPPSLDPFSAKNGELPADVVAAIVDRTDLVVEGNPLPRDGRAVLQVSRWDRLKDMAGVMSAFTGHLADLPDDVHLVLAGPETSGVQDDPEAAAVLEECRELWRGLPEAARARTHLLSMPMRDLDENARLVNALQRWADVVVQKSIAEGFGLTVTEPMWKAKPVVASAVGGIRDQIEHGVSGLLLDDPHDLDGLAAALGSLLTDPVRSASIGQAAKERVRDRFLADRHLIQYVELFDDLINA